MPLYLRKALALANMHKFLKQYVLLYFNAKFQVSRISLAGFITVREEQLFLCRSVTEELHVELG